MPGADDPANQVVPQQVRVALLISSQLQALSAFLFPQASKLTTLCGVPNPYECRVGGVRILGTSGQGVDDIYRFAATEDR